MSNYLNRFYPLQSIKLLLRQRKQVLPSVTSPLPRNQAAKAVETTLTLLDRQQLNFTVVKNKSSIPNAGNGVYLKGADQKKGQIVSFYPGTIYMPSEPILFVSIANQYILKCVDGLYVDGKRTGLSGKVYKSLYRRENWPGAIQISDWTWMKDENLINPLAVGQFVNNGTKDYKANVCYQEVDLPISFPNELRKFIPNMYWDTEMNPLSHPMRVVALVSLREIQDGEELFSTYMDII
ncbi:hypothetical protein BD770DRAFT_379204 [Pilaira anomala]|nr:hypothetical protein BD770DRAFT_379204 [Pilaira anomala]